MRGCHFPRLGVHPGQMLASRRPGPRECKSFRRAEHFLIKELYAFDPNGDDTISGVVSHRHLTVKGRGECMAQVAVCCACASCPLYTLNGFRAVAAVHCQQGVFSCELATVFCCGRARAVRSILYQAAWTPIRRSMTHLQQWMTGLAQLMCLHPRTNCLPPLGQACAGEMGFPAVHSC